MTADALFDLPQPATCSTCGRHLHGQPMCLWCQGSTITGRQHPETSRAAAGTVLPITGTQRRRVYDAIAAAAGMTDDEIVATTGLSPNSVRPRRVELANAGLIHDSGRRRRNHLGNECIVWEVTA